MPRIALTRTLNALPIISAVFLSSCTIDVGPPGPLQTESKTVPLDNNEMVRVDLKMGAGELRLQGGSDKLMDAQFRFRRLALKPDVRYDSSGFRGQLTVEEPSQVRAGNNGDYEWDLRFNNDKLMDLNVNFGAGEARLDAGSLNLRSVEIHMGVGELRLDLRGTPRRDYDVRIRGGVGEATVYLPENVGIAADAKGGIGGIKVRGLHESGDRYVNDLYGHAKTNIRLDIRGGVGSINLIAE